MLLVKRDEIFVGNSSLEFELETSISASKENRRKQLKVPFKGTQWLVLLTRRKRGKIKRLPLRLRFINDQLIEDEAIYNP